MPKPLVSGSELKCSFGDETNKIFVLPLPMYPTCEGKKIALEDTTVPFVNIKMFGKCSSPINPLVASATAAAGGVLQPQICTPMTTIARWVPASTSLSCNNVYAALETSKCSCLYQGEITVSTSVKTKMVID